MQYGRLIGSQGLELGHRAIDEMGRLSQPVSARNYEIWLAYLLSSNSPLRIAMDAAVARGDPLDDEAMDELYRTHFESNRLGSQALDTGTRIAHEVADTLDALKYLAAHSARYGETLDASSAKLRSGSVDKASLPALISQLALASSEMSARNAALSGKLSESSAEMEQLRISLQQAKSQALTDGLTGIANRKQFNDTISMRVSEARHDGTSLALVLCDIDHFKKFNDTWGHQLGDTVIQMVATSLTRAVLPDHLVARIGGEEFAMLMPRTTLDNAVQLANGVREKIHASRLKRKQTGEIIGHVSVSFGVACIKPEDDIPRLIQRADECLYLSKGRGRNCVSTEDDLRAAA